MQVFFANFRAALAGIAAACVAVALFAVLSVLALSEHRLTEVVRTAVAQNDLAWAARPNEDFLTDCALLEMQYLRQGNIFRSALDTKF